MSNLLQEINDQIKKILAEQRLKRDTDRYLCPECGGSNLEVAVTCWARLDQEPDGNFETNTDDVRDHSHEWDDLSAIRCRDCEHGGLVRDFAPQQERIT